MKVMLCPGNSGPHLTLLKKALEDEDVEVKVIPWFGKQFPYSLAKLLYHRLRGYKILNMNWIPFNKEWQFEMVKAFCKLMDIKVVWTLHNLEPHEPQFGNQLRDSLMVERMAYWSDVSVVHSDRTAEEFIEKYSLTTLPVKVIPLANYRDATKFKQRWIARSKLKFTDNKKYVLMLGPSHFYKGVEQFAWEVKNLPDNYIGVMVGKCNNKGLKEFMEKVKNNFPEKFILDLRYLSEEEVAEYYAACDVFFMPFNKITTSGSIMDAITHGMPVVTTNLGNNYMLVEDGINGYLANTPEEMQKAIINVCEGDRESFVHHSLMIADRYTWDKTARDYLSIFWSLE